MTPDPGASAFERLRELQSGWEIVAAALETLEQRFDQDASLVHALAAQARKLNEKTSDTVALLPTKRGRRLEEIPPNFLQKVKTLHEERGWGRGRILAAMRAEGAKEWMVRRALAEIAGGNSGSSRRAQATFSDAPPRKEAP